MAYNGKSTEKWYSSYVKRTIPQDLGTSMAFGIAGSVIGRKNRVVNRWLNRVYIK